MRAPEIMQTTNSWVCWTKDTAGITGCKVNPHYAETRIKGWSCMRIGDEKKYWRNKASKMKVAGVFLDFEFGGF